MINVFAKFRVIVGALAFLLMVLGALRGAKSYLRSLHGT
jgi:hypothetical protein